MCTTWIQTTSPSVLSERWRQTTYLTSNFPFFPLPFTNYILYYSWQACFSTCSFYLLQKTYWSFCLQKNTVAYVTKKVVVKLLTGQCWEVTVIRCAAQLTEAYFLEALVHRPFSLGAEGSDAGQQRWTVLIHTHSWGRTGHPHCEIISDNSRNLCLISS